MLQITFGFALNATGNVTAVEPNEEAESVTAITPLCILTMPGV